MALVKITSLLNSRPFTKKVFVAVAILHFILFYVLGIIVTVENKANLSPQILVQFSEDLYYFFTYAHTFLTNPLFIYSSSAQIIGNFLDLPSFVLYMSAWYTLCLWLFPIANLYPLYLDLYQSLIIYDLSLVILNLVNCFLIYKIMTTRKLQEMLGNSVLSNPFLLMSMYMGTSIFFIDYFVGQYNELLGFFLLLGCLYYLEGKEEYTYFFWGIGMALKSILAIFIVVIILHGPMKRFLKNAAFLALSQIPNGILFGLYPSLIPDYIHNVLFRLSSPLIFTIPVNLIQFLYQFFNIDITVSYIFVYCSLLPLTAFAFIECKKTMNFFDKLMILTLLSINLIQGEPNHVIITLGVYLIWIATMNTALKGSGRFLKLMVGIPFLSGLLWLVFPFNPLIYFSSVIWFNLLFIFSKQPSLDQAGR